MPACLQPLVSVIVPVYNSESFLRPCMDSLSAQTLERLEILCINDGSSDQSQEILDKFAQKDPRIVIISKPNAGYGHSINMGIDAAKGKYIGIVEADDYVDSRMFEKLATIAEANDADIVKSDYYNLWEEKERTISKNLWEGFETHTEQLLTPKEYPFLFLLPPSIWSAIYKKELLVTNHIRCNETPGASYQDTAFHFKVLASAQQVWLHPERLLFYRRDNEQSSSASKNKAFFICNEHDSIQSWLIENNRWLPPYSGLAVKLRYNGCLWNLKRISRKLKWPFLRRMQQDFRQLARDNILDSSELGSMERAFLHLVMRRPRLALAYYLFSRTNILTVTSGNYLRVKLLGLRIYKKKTNIPPFFEQESKDKEQSN